MDRREFLRMASAAGGAAALGGLAFPGCRDDGGTDDPGNATCGGDPRPASILDHPASECPIDTILVVMMENRSFDHLFGWLADDSSYLDDGRRRYGSSFAVDGRTDQLFRDPLGAVVATIPVTDLRGSDPYRGCGHPVPDHSWVGGRVERDDGFLAPLTHNDEFAISYYDERDLPFLAPFAKRFTVLDRHFASLLGPTFPNRQYLHSATSEGHKKNPLPLDSGHYAAPTIWDRLGAANVPAAYYYSRLPLLLLWGDRLEPFIRPLDRYFQDAAAGTLPNVAMIDPDFNGSLRTDCHPGGDTRLGERFLLEVFAAFAQSPHWERGAFVLVYDEWGGFFDHVAPPLLRDDRTSSQDDDNFGQAGFRVPAVLASPFARRGYVDHRRYDHTSILRFIEWRFLGAPPEGAGQGKPSWSLTQRDRCANNIGASLRPDTPEPEVGIEVHSIVDPSDPCRGRLPTDLPYELEKFEPSDRLANLIDAHYPAPTLTPWLEAPAPRRL
jgi:phospholipase C